MNKQYLASMHDRSSEIFNLKVNERRFLPSFVFFKNVDWYKYMSISLNLISAFYHICAFNWISLLSISCSFKYCLSSLLIVVGFYMDCFLVLTKGKNYCLKIAKLQSLDQFRNLYGMTQFLFSAFILIERFSLVSRRYNRKIYDLMFVGE